jgi:hypothetical protein
LLLLLAASGCCRASKAYRPDMCNWPALEEEEEEKRGYGSLKLRRPRLCTAHYINLAKYRLLMTVA